jgi:O-methyltransferase
MDRPYSIVPMFRLESFCDLMGRISKGLSGAVIEVGVWQGGTAAYLPERFPDRKIYLCDTFTGIPYAGDNDGGNHPVGSFSNTSVDVVREYFNQFPNVSVHQGVFPDELKGLLNKETFAFVHLDVDMYQSYLDGLNFLYPRMVKGCICVLDDYHIASAPGCDIAVDEFLSGKPEHIREYFDEYYFIKE